MIRHIMRLFYIPIVFIVIVACWVYFGLSFNLSDSLPIGLYRVISEKPNKGQLVILCVDNKEMVDLARNRHYLLSGKCPGNVSHLIKIIYGLPGDVISFDNDKNIILNGNLLSNSKPMAFDSKGQPMPSTELNAGIIPPDKVLLLALNHPNSFDARYWGLQPIENIKVVKPVWVSSKGEFK